MLTWHVDRLWRAGPLCALGCFVLPALLAVWVALFSDVSSALGVGIFGSFIIFCGALFGSSVTSGFGCLVFAIGAATAEVSPWVLLVASIGLFATLVLQDLAGAFHRGPSINRLVWSRAAVTVALVAAASTAAFALTYLVATLAVWQTIVVPLGFAAIGIAAKLAADSHFLTARAATLNRSKARSAATETDGS